MIRTLIVDDEPLAREHLRARLGEASDVDVVGEAADGLEAVERIVTLEPDLVFLDVQMPELDGFQVLERVAERHLPVIVFVSAYDRFALRAFEIHALDYLLKPYSGPRFHEALARVRRELERDDPDPSERLAALLEARGGERRDGGIERFVVRDRGRFVLLPAREVDWIEAAGNYVELHARGHVYLARRTMKELEAGLPPRRFVRVHRSIIVNVDRVREVRPDPNGDYQVTLDGGQSVPMSRTHRGALLGD